MAETTYTHSIADDTLHGEFDAAKYGAEVRAKRALITTFVGAWEDGADIKTKFSDALSQDNEDILDAVVAAHDGREAEQVAQLVDIDTPKDAEGHPVTAPSFTDTGGYDGVYLGFRWEIEQGTTDIYDYTLNEDTKLQGGYRRVYGGGADPVDGDYMEMEVVDDDNSTGMYDGTNPNGINPLLIDLDLTVGTDVLSVFKYVRDEHTDEDEVGKRIEYMFASAKFVPSLLKLRAKFVSNGTGEADIIMKCGYKGYEA